MPPRPVRRLKAWFDAGVGWATVLLLKILRRMNRQRTSNFFGRLMRHVGPWLPEHKVGRENLKAAFPDKSPQEIEKILAGVWENLGRVGAEFAHIDRIKIRDPERGGDADVTYDSVEIERFEAIRARGKSTIFFGSHLANWEIPALGPPAFNIKSSFLFRRPNIRPISDAVVAMRRGCMGNLIPAGLDAPVRLANAIERGELVGALVDQHFSKGVDVVFFGRWAKTNPLIAQLARHTECPIRGVRVVRRPDGNSFTAELTDEITPVRDAEGKIDIQGTTQVITGVVEGWVREHPEQWLWLHRRWR
jgi:Kdo2-lipid IVA lauroyltransferase/acyltransferase